MKSKKSCFFALLSCIVILLTGCSENYRLLTGGFSENGEGGINVFNFNPSKGELKQVSSFNAGANPSYFCFANTRDLIYAINEVSEFMGVRAGGLTTIKHDGKLNNLEKVSEMPVPTFGPCYISTDADDMFLFVANYAGGSVAVIRLNGDGIPDKVTDSIVYDSIGTRKSHAHMIGFDPSGGKIYVSDLGLDRVMIYNLDRSTGRLVPLTENGIPLPEGTGPRHFVFSEDGKTLYLMGELNNTVTVFSVSEDGSLNSVQTTSSLDSSTGTKNYSADIHIGNDGKYLYATNRGDNTVSVFRIAEDGTLSGLVNTPCGGDWPRNFTLDPSGRFILVGNQKSDQVSVLEINRETGVPENKISEFNIPAPACLRFITY